MKKKFPGTLFLIVGNSGSGKDSIISGVVKKYPPYLKKNSLKKIYLTRRYITRPASETEDNYSVTPEEFSEMELHEKFSLKWHIYSLDYGVPIEIDDWLKKGHPVIVNVSRTIVDEARDIYENLKVVFIEVPFQITLQRVKDRGRETGALLNDRIERAKINQKFPSADFVVDNSGDLNSAIDQFLNYMLNVVS